MGVAIALALGAMWRYPGGTVLDPSTAAYSLSENFFSDLGMTVAYNGQSNRLGAALFVASLLALVAGAGIVLRDIWRVHEVSMSSRAWARAAFLVAAIVCVAFAGVAFTPMDRAMSAHYQFTLLAWRLAPAAAALLAVASAKSEAFPRRATVLWTALSAVLLTYIVILTWGPSIRTAEGLRLQVLSQKGVAIFLVGALLLAQVAGPKSGRNTFLPS